MAASSAAVPQPGRSIGPGQQPQRWTSFGDFFKKSGMEIEAREEAKEVAGFDADILEMRSLSTTAKVRMQRERNYQRIIARRKFWFERDISLRGFAERWL